MIIDNDSLAATLLALTVVIGSVAAFGGVGAAQQPPSASVTVDAPTGATTGTPARFEVTISVGDVDNVSVAGNVSVALKIDGQTVATRTVRVSDDQTRTVTLTHSFAANGTYTVSAEASLTTLGRTFSRSGQTTVTVEEGPGRPTLPGAATPAADLDGDGLLEDANGDGNFDILDVTTLLNALDSAAVQNNVASFDFSGDSSISIIDVADLLDRLR